MYSSRRSRPPTGSPSRARSAASSRSASTTSAPSPTTRRRSLLACVEGWSTTQRWTGVRLRDLLARAGAAPRALARIESLQQHRSYRTSDLNPWQAHDPDTLLALLVNDEPLALDHGYPLRLIAPDRPGVMQTKWVTRVVVK